MQIFLAIAWRNVMRNKKRSFITIFAIAFGLTALIFMWSLFDGISIAMLENMTSLYMGHMEISDSVFVEKPNLENAIVFGKPVIDIVKDHPDIESYSPRLRAFGLVSSGDKSQGVAMIGIDPALEREFGGLDDYIQEGGRWLTDKDVHGVIVGATVAKNLDVGLGEEITPFTMNRYALSANLWNMTIVGIIKTNVPSIDNSSLFMRRSELATALFDTEGVEITDPGILPKFGPSGIFSEVAIRVADTERMEELKEELGYRLTEAFEKAQQERREELKRRVTISSGEMKAALQKELREDPKPRTPIVRTWSEIVPWMKQAMEMRTAFGYVVVLIMLVVVVVGILNTVLMSVMERAREFGIMKALGTKGRQISLIVSLESILLGLVGLVIGALGGIILTLIFNQVGLDLYGMLDESILGEFYMEPVIYPLLNLQHLATTCIMVMVMIVLVSLYPARKAAKMEPVNAIKALG